MSQALKSTSALRGCARCGTGRRMLGPLVVIAACLGCDMGDMYDQAHFEPLEPTTLFPDGSSSRPLVPGTVARGQLHADTELYTGRRDGEYVTELPVKLDRALLERGRQRFNIYCSVCHDFTGSGRGMVVQRGFRRPPTFHSDRLRAAPLGHFFDVMTAGFGAMPSYSSQVEPRDRWAIAAYIRVLQLSQNAPPEEASGQKPAETSTEMTE